MTTFRSTVSSLLVPGLRKVMFMEYDQVPSTYKEVFNVESSTRAYEEWVGLAGVGPAEEKPEGQGIIYKDIQQTNVKRVSMVTYALGMRCTMEAKMDEQYGQLKKLAQVIGRAHKVREEVEAWNIFNMSFTTALATGYDGLALISRVHPIKGTGFGSGAGFTATTAGVVTSTDLSSIPTRSQTTAANRLVTDADLDYTSLIDMLTLFRRQVDETGDYVTILPQNLVIAPENEWVAYEILKSNMRPDTTNNAVSSVQRINLNPVQSPYLIDTDAWWLTAPKGQHDLMFFDRMAYTTSSEDHFDTGDTLIKGVRRFGTGFADWRGIVGTAGA